MGDAAVGPFQAHGGDHAGLGIVPADSADAGLGADHRAAPLGADRQRRGQRPAVLKGHDRRPGLERRAGDPRRRQHLYPRSLHRRRQGGADVAVFQKVAQGLALRQIGDLGGVEAQEEWRGRAGRGARRTAVGDQDLLDPLGVGVEGRRQAQRAPLPVGRIGDGRGAAIEGGRRLGVKNHRVDQDRLHAGLRQGQRQGRPGDAGAGNDHVTVESLVHRGDRPRTRVRVQPVTAVVACQIYYLDCIVHF